MPGSNLTLHSYHVTAISIIADKWRDCKMFCEKCVFFFVQCLRRRGCEGGMWLPAFVWECFWAVGTRTLDWNACMFSVFRFQNAGSPKYSACMFWLPDGAALKFAFG